MEVDINHFWLAVQKPSQGPPTCMACLGLLSGFRAPAECAESGGSWIKPHREWESLSQEDEQVVKGQQTCHPRVALPPFGYFQFPPQNSNQRPLLPRTLVREILAEMLLTDPSLPLVAWSHLCWHTELRVSCLMSLLSEDKPPEDTKQVHLAHQSSPSSQALGPGRAEIKSRGA